MGFKADDSYPGLVFSLQCGLCQTTALVSHLPLHLEKEHDKSQEEVERAEKTKRRIHLSQLLLSYCLLFPGTQGALKCLLSMDIATLSSGAYKRM